MHPIRPSRAKSGLTLAVPTFRRPQLLGRLIEQVTRQTLLPDALVVIDGEGGAPEVRAVAGNSPIPTRFIPSTLANLPFQRYLGRLAAPPEARALLYLDDDMVLPEPDAIERLTAPLLESWPDVVAVTANINTGKQARPPSQAARRFGAARKAKPGSLTVGGVRIEPDGDADYAHVQWLRGGVMGFRADILSSDCFPEDLFALAGRGWGMGEDLALARRVLRKGRILLVRNARFDHPSEDVTRAVNGKDLQFGFASAYSRRLLLDLYRGDVSPLLTDRLALVRTWGGAFLAAAGDGRGVFAAGYAAGALFGMCRPPTSELLSPGVDWQFEAARSLDRMEAIRI